jgi:hypothetical protein
VSGEASTRITLGGIGYALVIGLAVTNHIYAVAAAVGFYGAMLALADIARIVEDNHRRLSANE